MNANDIKQAAQKVPASKRIGDKVFLSDVRAAMNGVPTSAFKAAVVAGWESGELNVSRWDLVEVLTTEQHAAWVKSVVVRGHAEAHMVRI